MTFPKVSIIIPIFNVGKHLRPCLDSASNQSLREIEIICVNDGSTDDSLAIIREFERSDPRIILIDQPNGGVASARNAGLDRAKGKYIRFLDGDDLLPLNACEILYDFAEKNGSDLLVCGYDYIPKEGKRTSLFIYPDASFDLGDVQDRRVVFSNYLLFGTQNQFFRAETVKNIRFKPLSNGEDHVFYLEALCASRTFSTLGKPGYIYSHRDDSASHQHKATVLLRFLKSRKELIRILGKVDKMDQVEDLISRKILSWAVRDLAESLKTRKDPEEGFQALFSEWKSCYRESILQRRKRNYRGQSLARMVFQVDSFYLYLFLSKMIGFYVLLRRWPRARN